MNLEFIKPQNLGSLLMKSRHSNFNLTSPGSHLVRSYLITTVQRLWITLSKLEGRGDYAHHRHIGFVVYRKSYGYTPEIKYQQILAEPEK